MLFNLPRLRRRSYLFQIPVEPRASLVSCARLQAQLALRSGEAPLPLVRIPPRVATARVASLLVVAHIIQQACVFELNTAFVILQFDKPGTSVHEFALLQHVDAVILGVPGRLQLAYLADGKERVAIRE
jgi:hypothetical protein